MSFPPFSSHLQLVVSRPAPLALIKPCQGQTMPATYSENVVSTPLVKVELLEALEGLELDPRVVLEIVALAGEAMSLRRLIEIGRSLASGQDFTPTRLGPIVTNLVQLGLLYEGGDALVCCPGLAEHLAVGSMVAGRAASITEQLRKHEPWSKGLQRDELALFRRFRNYLYGGDFTQANGLATDLERLGSRRAWSDVGRCFLSPQSFFAFAPMVALNLARETLMQSLNKPFPAPNALTAFGQLVRFPSATDKDKQLYGHALLISGQREAFDDYLDLYDFPTLEGCRKLLDGDLAGLDDFERGLREAKFFSSYTALFLYLVGLLAREGLDSPRAATEIAKYEPFRAPFEWMLAVKSGRISELTTEMRRRLKEAPDALVPHLCLILYWAGFRYDELSLADRARAYREAGYSVFADWLSWAADNDVHQGKSPPPLIALLQADEHWRKVLCALNAWSAPSRELAGSAERIVWHIEPFVVRRAVEPRLQKQGKKGVFSPGRLLELDEIWEKPPACADAFDWRVFDALQRLDRGKHHRLGYTTGPEQHNAALLALAGHPRVYLKKSPEAPVELVVEPVAVQVRRYSSHLELKLDPPPAWGPMVLAEPGDPGKVRLFNVTERHVQLGRMIDASLKIPLEGEAALRETLAGLTTAGLALRSDIELSGEAQDISPDQTLLIRLSPYADGLSVQVRVAPLGEGGPLFAPGEGSPVVAGRVQGRSVQTRRDLVVESQRWSELSRLRPELFATDFTLLNALESLTFLECFLDLQDERFRLEWPEGEKFAVAMRLQLSQITQSVRSQGDWFSVGAEVRVDEDLVLSLTDLLESRRQAKGRYVPLEGGRFLALTDEVERYLDRLERLSHRQAKGELQLHPLGALLALEGQQLQADEAWLNLKRRLENSQHLEPVVPSSLNGELREYQAEGVRWLLRLAHWGVGACLADDMGLGKTVQLLALLLSRSKRGPALVVAPTSVCWNWVEETERFAPSLRIVSLNEERLGPGDVMVLSYGVLINHVERLKEVTWATLVLDEAQAIKNAGTQRARAAHVLQADFRVAATGTPVENHPEEMWALFRFLNPGLLGSRKGFGQRFGNPAGQEELSRLVRPFILRRTKNQVLKELPPRTEILEKVELSPSERALYESMRREAVESLENPGEGDYLSVLAHLTRLRRVCCHPRLVVPEGNLPSAKLSRCLELLEELIDNGHRALVFSQFVSYLQLLRSELEARGISYAYLDGSTPPAARRKAVRDFQDGEGELFLISLKAGGTGLNLTGADYVVHLDPWWNPAVEDQASDRAHRMGQRRPVTVYRLVAQATIEEQIVELHGQKRDLAQRLLEGTEGTSRLSATELLELLRL